MDIKITLERNTYDAGKTAKGFLFTRAHNNIKVRKLKFSVCGKERYEEEMSTYGGGSSEKYDIFFSEDLHPLLESTNVFPHIADVIIIL